MVYKNKKDKQKYDKEYEEKNSKKIAIGKIIYYKENREQILSKQKIYRESKDGSKAIKESHKKWRENNKDKIKKWDIEYNKKNPKAKLIRSAIRRARIKNQIPNWVYLKKVKIFYRECPEGMEVDHIIPIAKRGIHCVENLQYLTPDANKRKAAKIPRIIPEKLSKIMEVENARN